jgi:hypothetical protein
MASRCPARPHHTALATRCLSLDVTASPSFAHGLPIEVWNRVTGEATSHFDLPVCALIASDTPHGLFKKYFTGGD